MIVWRQTMEARICQVCDKPMCAFRGLGQSLEASDTTPVWMRSVHADHRDGEPRLHFAELETCSDRCKQAVLTNFAQRGELSRNDFIDSADALAKEQGARCGPIMRRQRGIRPSADRWYEPPRVFFYTCQAASPLTLPPSLEK